MAAYDLAIIGGGIVGLAVAVEVLERHPSLSLVLLEKEGGLALHQTGRNSGVVHAGAYYPPGSLKARLCREGVEATLAFCRAHALPFEQCGKLLVATDAVEMPRLDALHERCRANGLRVERLDARELSRREPNIRGIAALHIPTTSIVDYGAISAKLGEIFVSQGGELRLDAEVQGVEEESGRVVLSLGRTRLEARAVIACAGMNADRIARMSGLDLDFQIVPFRGEYFRLAPRHDHVVNHLIYPIPDPALPFLGVHLTKMIGGFVTVGPNAVLALGREAYRWRDVSLRDLAEMARHPGFARTIWRHRGAAASEIWSSLSKQRYLSLCQRYCPSLERGDLLPFRPGIRAQAVFNDGTLAHDFLIRQTQRIIHVCNAPSPAATAAIPIAREIVGQASEQFRW